MIRVPLPANVRHSVQAHLDNCREKAIAQVSHRKRFDSRSMSEIRMFQQLTGFSVWSQPTFEMS